MGRARSRPNTTLAATASRLDANLQTCPDPDRGLPILRPRNKAFCDFLDDITDPALWLPCWVVNAESVRLADPPNVIADARRIDIRLPHRPINYELGRSHGLHN